MPHDPARVDETRAWLVKASDDLQAARLTVFAWSSRYPGDPAEPDADEVREAIVVAQEVLDAVLYRLPPDVRR